MGFENVYPYEQSWKQWGSHTNFYPVFSDAPQQWLENRPKPQDEYIHFHSCYDSQGSVTAGYWLKHIGSASFTYDMGNRVGPDSVLFHEVSPGIDTSFARLMEFDKGISKVQTPR